MQDVLRLLYVPSTPLNPFLIHVIHVLPRDLVLLHDLPKELEVAFDGSLIESLGTLRIQPRWFPPLELLMATEEPTKPLARRGTPESSDMHHLLAHCALVERSSDCAQMNKPVDESALLRMRQELLSIVREVAWSCDAEKAAAKGVIAHLELASSLTELAPALILGYIAEVLNSAPETFFMLDGL
ncbi:hypothetical protein BD413DRAFT_552388 [Trametes elegans]|nr:hypothetical protein BD413DRAFT_552388 [Trametes elegans]